MFYIIVNPDNSLNGLYSDKNNVPIPTGAVSITDQEAQMIIADPDSFTYYDLVDGVVTKNQTRFDVEKLSIAKSDKLNELKHTTGLKLNEILPGKDIPSEATLGMLKEFWLSLATAAKNPTPKMTTIINIFQAWANAHDAINALSTVAEVDTYDVSTDPNWP